MDQVRIFAGCVIFTIAGQVSAACDSNTQLLSSTAIDNHLSGNTVCGTGVGANAGDNWQEYHQAGGTLTEYAKGPADPVDPTHDVGTWGASGNNTSAVVTYNYTGGGSYSFNVHVDSATTEFCNGSSLVATATLLSGPQSCGF